MKLIARIGASVTFLLCFLVATEQANAANTCASYIQGKIAWDYKGNKHWAQSNINNLCREAEASRQPGACFNRVMHGGVNWGGGTKWRWPNALNLCQGSTNASSTISCFKREISKKRSWRQAIAACKKITNKTTTVTQVNKTPSRTVLINHLFTFIPHTENHNQNNGDRTDTQAANTNSDDVKPGPSKATIDIVSAMAQYSGVEDDFDDAIGWSRKLFRGKKDRNTYYYLPKRYLLQRGEDQNTGYQMKFTYGNISDADHEAKVSFNALLGPSNRKGDLKLLLELLRYAVNNKNSSKLRIKPFPMMDTQVKFDDLKQAFDIKDKDIYMSDPQNIDEPIELVIRMKESVQSEFVTYLRNNGLSGRFLIKNDTVGDIEIPIRMEFKQYSGPVVSNFDDVNQRSPLVNLSGFPVTVDGFISYSEGGNHKLRRQFHPFKSPVRIPPGGTRKVPNFRKLIKGRYIDAWFDTKMDESCLTCIDAIEKGVLASASNLRKTKLSLEAMPNVFTDKHVYKVIVEIESKYFDLSNTKQVRTFTLKIGKSSINIPVYVDPGVSDDLRSVKYRYKYIKSDGPSPDNFAPWQESQAFDITITPLDVAPTKDK